MRILFESQEHQVPKASTMSAFKRYERSAITERRHCSAQEPIGHSLTLESTDWSVQDRGSDNLSVCNADRGGDCGEPCLPVRNGHQ